MTIKVFEINETVKEEKLSSVDIKNIQKIFSKIFSPENTDHLKVECKACPNSILNDYKNHQKKFELRKFADKLKKAEQKKDNTRNRQITEGNLFIKADSNQLILLKLENIEVIDKEKNYEMKTSFSTESNYYKGCIFKKNLKEITIIDKNKSVAKYWREDFLSLLVIKDGYENSKELIQMLKEDQLFSNEIKNQGNFQEIKRETEDYIFEKDSFDKVSLFCTLTSNELINNEDLNCVYSEESKKIDSEFLLSNRAIKEAYKKTISVSPDTKIYTDNYMKLIRRQGIYYKDGRLILPVDKKFIDKLPEELRNKK